MTENQERDQVTFQVSTDPVRIQELQAGGFGVGSKWDAPAEAAIQARDAWREEKKTNKDAQLAYLKIGFGDKEPTKARAFVQDMLTQRIRKMTAERTEEQGGRLRATVRIALGEDDKPVGLVAFAEPDFERPKRKPKPKVTEAKQQPAT